MALSAAAYQYSVDGGLNLLVRENGLLENGQLVFVFASLIVFAISGIKFEGPVRTAARAMAGVCLMCFYREIDLRSADVPGWVGAATGSPIRDIVMVAMGLAILGYVFRCRAHVRDWLHMLLRFNSWPLIVSGALLFIAAMLDNKFVTSDAGRFWEELTELIGYILLLEASWRHMLVGRSGKAYEAG